MEVDPYTNESVLSKEEYAAELRRELDSLKRRSAYILELLMKVNPTESIEEAIE